MNVRFPCFKNVQFPNREHAKFVSDCTKRVCKVAVRSLARLGNYIKNFVIVCIGHCTPVKSLNPTGKALKKGQPIVMVHGLFSAGGTWKTHKQWLEKQGFGPVFLLTLPSTTRDIKKNVAYVQDFLKDVKRKTGRDDVVLIGHSMGGLISLDIATQEGSTVEKVITLGSPLEGSKLAGLVPKGLFKSCDQMTPNSTYLQDLKGRINQQPDSKKFFHFMSFNDPFIYPKESAARMKPNAENVYQFNHLTHLGFLTDKRVSDKIVHLLKVQYV